MGAERPQLPDWAREEREGDLAWINDHVPLFELASRIAYEGSGRGAIVADTTAQPVPGLGYPFGYLTREQLDEHGDEDTQRMVREYEPDAEFVVVLLKEEGRSSTYRVRTQDTPSSQTAE